MRRLVMLGFAAALLAPLPANAEKLDVSTITCKQFLEFSKEKGSLLLTWLEGYYSADEDDPIIDSDKMMENAKALGAACAKDPDIGLITTAEKIYGK